MTAADDASATPQVHALGSAATIDDLEEGTWYVGTVNGVVPYGVFVDLNEQISGLVHESNLPGEYDVGEEIVVTLESVKPNGDVAFEATPLEEYEVVPLDPAPDPREIADLEVGQDDVTITGRVDQIKQTAGPTIFAITDGNRVLPCAAFEAAGQRAYPAIDTGDVVEVLGTPTRHDGGLQLEATAMSVLDGDRAEQVRSRVQQRIEEQAEPAAIDPLVDWPAFDPLWEDLGALARDLRGAILESRPIRIRHHADGDGMCGAVPLTVALERFTATVHCDPDAPDHLISRSPSKAPYYEMEDATRDLNRALEDRAEHGQRLPYVLMLDNGSTEEDLPAYRNLAHYDIPIAVVDHHHPDLDAVDGLLAHHVNPYRHGEDYRITTGMMCTELARMIDPDLTGTIQHIPAIAGLADRSSAGAMSAYLDLASSAGYDREDVELIGDALDYAAHWLQYRPGSVVVRDILGITDEADRHEELVAHFADEATDAIDEQLAVATSHLVTESLPNGATLNRLDVDAHAYRFRYPAPGKTTGAVHDASVESSGDPTVTLGYGPDFCVLRSDAVRLDIPAIVDSLQEELPGAGVSGGGHLVVGSIKFVRGRREDVLDLLVEHLAAAPIDESLTSAKAGVETGIGSDRGVEGDQSPGE